MNDQDVFEHTFRAEMAKLAYRRSLAAGAVGLVAGGGAGAHLATKREREKSQRAQVLARQVGQMEASRSARQALQAQALKLKPETRAAMMRDLSGASGGADVS